MSERKRAGFTLIELLIVLSILAVVMVILLPFIAKSNDADIVPRGARLVQGALMQAKSRAQLEKRYSGVRFLPGVQSPFWSQQIEAVQDPGDFIDGFAVGPLPMPVSPLFPIGSPYSNNPLPPYYLTAIFPDVAFPYSVVAVSKTPVSVAPNPAGLLNNLPAAPGLGDGVRPGDYVEFNGNGQVFQVVGFPGQNVGIPAGNGHPAYGIPPAIPGFPYGTTMLVSRLMNFQALPPNIPTNYRVIRAPRPIPGERPQELPQGVVLDFTPPFNGVGGALSVNDKDNASGSIWVRGLSSPFGDTIMFAPSGQLIGPSAAFDTIFLWFHPDGLAANWINRNPNASLGEATNQALLVIYAKTGGLTSYPVDPGVNPFSYAQTGRAQNIGGL